MRTAAVGNLTGAVTSAGVFLLALLTGFQGLRELGVIAGVGLLMCLVSMTVVLPALLVLGERSGAATSIGRAKMPGETAFRRDEQDALRGLPGWVLLGTTILSGWFLIVVPEQLRFEKAGRAAAMRQLASGQW